MWHGAGLVFGCWLLGVSLLARGQGMGLLVPAYFEPANEGWRQLSAAAQRVPLVAIANIFNGPGADTTARSDSVQVIQQVRAAGGQVIGYVYTSYGTRPIDAVKADLQRWHDLYAVDGFFVDEMSNQTVRVILDYYAELWRYGHELSPSGLVIGNPGTNTDELYLKRPTVDGLVIFENSAGYASFVPAVWTSRYPAFQFTHLIYGVDTAEQMTNDVNLAVKRHAGLVYVTDDSGANPWDRLPSYWDAEVSWVEGINRTAAEQTGGSLRIRFDSGAGVTVTGQGSAGRHVLEAAPALGDWQPFGTNLTTTGSSAWSTPTLGQQRLFRLRQD